MLKLVCALSLVCVVVNAAPPHDERENDLHRLEVLLVDMMELVEKG